MYSRILLPVFCLLLLCPALTLAQSSAEVELIEKIGLQLMRERLQGAQAGVNSQPDTMLAAWLAVTES